MDIFWVRVGCGMYGVHKFEDAQDVSRYAMDPARTDY